MLTDINHPTARATPVGPWLGSAIAVSFVLSSAAARADEPSAPPPPPTVVAPTPALAAPSPAVAAPTPALAAPTSAVPSWSAPANGQPPPTGYYAPPPSQEASCGPEVIRAKASEVAPAGYHVEYRIRKGTVVTGAVIFGLPYAFSFLAGGGMMSKGEPRAAVLFLPVVGPFILPGIASADTGIVSGLLILDGLMQVAGAATLAVGLNSKRRMFVRDDVAKSFVMPVPMRFGANSAGLGVVGTF